MVESILDSIKIMLGIEASNLGFDAELLMHINSIFIHLNQLGVGPEDVFMISDGDDTWEDFLDEDVNKYSLIKSYMFIKVKLLFDLPQNSFLVSAYQKQAEEYEWRLQLQAEPYTLTTETEEVIEEEITF